MEEEKEQELTVALTNFVQSEKPFEIEVSGFGHFSKRAVFVEVKNKQVVRNFFERFQQVINNTLDIKDHETTSDFHPHLTIATRDLHKKNFQQAWEDFKNREFEDSFKAESFNLFKHNHKTWDILNEFKISE